MKKILSVIAACVLIAGVVFALRNNHQPAPAFNLPELNGQTRLSEQVFTGKVTLLNFWYPSCPGCVTEMPKLTALQQKFGKNGYQTVAIALNHNTEAEVRAYLSQYPLPFITAYDADNQVAQTYSVQFTPTSFLIDQHGKIIRSSTGEPDWAVWEKEINRLLAQ